MTIDAPMVGFVVVILAQCAALGKLLFDARDIKKETEENSTAIHGLDTRLTRVETKLDLLPCGSGNCPAVRTLK